MSDIRTNDKKGAQENGYRRALELLDHCSTSNGFLAGPTERANYHRIWARDGIILGLAALLSGEDRHRHCFRRTLMTLLRHQGWSAAAAVIAHQSLKGEVVFRGVDHAG